MVSQDESEGGLVVGDGEVLAGVCSESPTSDGNGVGVGGVTVSQLVVESSLEIDGGKAWEQRVRDNSKSFEVKYVY